MPKRKNPFQIRKVIGQKNSLPVSKTGRAIRTVKKYGIGRKIALLLITLVGMWIVSVTQQAGTGFLFKASVLEAPLPFTGTVFPVDQVPDWTNWGQNNATAIFSDLNSSQLTALPAYNLTRMQFPSENLEWGNNAHDLIRNTKITYPVVYLGNYELDHKENGGSHPAIDIKMPVGTPVKAIANGRVVKVSMTESGFGHHVVIKHTNVPDPDNPGKKTTLYSAFNHMDEIYVSEGETVTKGQIVGTSGNTGTSTTPHLHFQIDRESAPWHPYWPFSWSESQAAGLSFFEAVNAGLGLSSAQEFTINPMNYVAEYLDPDLSSVDSEDSTSSGSNNDTIDSRKDSDSEQDNDKQQEENIQDTEEEIIDTTTVDTGLFSFELVSEPTSMVNNGVTITATADKDDIERMGDKDEVRVTLSGVGRLSRKKFRKVDFKNSVIKFVVNSSDPGVATVSIGKANNKVNFIDEIKPINSLEIETDGNYQKNLIEIIKIQALDADGNMTPVVNFSGTIEVIAKEGQAKFVPDRLAVNDFKNGVAEVRMTVSNEERVKIRVQNGALIGESDYIYVEDVRPFSDISRAHPNYKAIKYLEANGIINGYEDGTFRADKTVNRVEALKMLMLAFDIEAGPNTQLPFNDTDESAWYAGTLATAYNKTIIKGYDDGSFKPAQTVNKAEYLKMLFETNDIEANSNLTASPYNDVPVNAWYSGYAYLTNKRNLLDVTNNILNADKGMTRGDVAETIYRLSYLLDNNLISYAK